MDNYKYCSMGIMCSISLFDLEWSDKSGKKENVAISGKTTFKLKHGDTITIENLPAGVSYKVEEATPSDYTMNATGQEGTMDAEAKTAAFTNTKTGDIDTGV